MEDRIINELITLRNGAIFGTCLLVAAVLLYVLIQFPELPEAVQTGVPSFVGFGLPWLIITLLDKDKWE